MCLHLVLGSHPFVNSPICRNGSDPVSSSPLSPFCLSIRSCTARVFPRQAHACMVNHACTCSRFCFGSAISAKWSYLICWPLHPPAPLFGQYFALSILHSLVHLFGPSRLATHFTILEDGLRGACEASVRTLDHPGNPQRAFLFFLWKKNNIYHISPFLPSRKRHKVHPGVVQVWYKTKRYTPHVYDATKPLHSEMQKE